MDGVVEAARGTGINGRRIKGTITLTKGSIRVNNSNMGILVHGLDGLPSGCSRMSSFLAAKL